METHEEKNHRIADKAVWLYHDPKATGKRLIQKREEYLEIWEDGKDGGKTVKAFYSIKTPYFLDRMKNAVRSWPMTKDYTTYYEN